MDKAPEGNKIAVNLPQEKIDFINEAHAKEIEYWKNVAFYNKNKEQRRRSPNVAPLKLSLYHRNL